MSIGSTVALAIERIVEPIEGMHRAIARRWFTVLGRAGAPVGLAHDSISSGVYGSVRLAGALAGLAVDAMVTARPSTVDAVDAFTIGLWGDELGRYADGLEIAMSFRDRTGAEIADDMAAAFPAATGHLVVLVHGLVETERCWDGNGNEAGLTQALDEHPALTPLRVRYNSGVRVSANGEQLASLLERLHSSWPVPVGSIALVGNSMGGLVIRSAYEVGRESGHGWIPDVTDVVTVGAPHLGTPLEKAVNVLASGLALAPETRPLANFLNSRSVGIKDLRFGAIVEEDWKGVDPDEFLVNTVGDHPLPPDVAHHFIAGVVTSDPTHPVGVAMGDLLVRRKSGTGGRRLVPSNVAVFGGLNHFDLIRNPAVIDRVVCWLVRAAN